MTTITLPRATVEQALEVLRRATPADSAQAREQLAALAALRAALAQQAEPDLSRCPQCNGPADNGFDRSFPPSPYLCTKCMAEPVEPVAWKQGNLVTFNEDPYPALCSLFVQFWDGEEVAARVYANDHETLRQRCAMVNAASPQRPPLTEEEMQTIYHEFMLYQDGLTPSGLQRVARAIERAHGIKE